MTLCLVLLFALFIDVSSIGLQVSWTNNTLPFVSVNPQCAQTFAPGRERLFILGGAGSVERQQLAAISTQVWTTDNRGAQWNQLVNQSSPTTLFAPTYSGGAAYLSNGNMLLFAGATPSAGGALGYVYLSTDGGHSWTLQTQQAFGGASGGRRQFGHAVMPNSNRVMVLAGYSGYSAGGIWLNVDGVGLVWTQRCAANAGCYTPFNGNSRVYGEALVALFDNRTWVSMGGIYSSTGGTIIPSNLVSYSTNDGLTWTSYVAPWTNRTFASATVDLANYVYLYGGIGNALGNGNDMLNDLWFSANVAGSNPVWQQIYNAPGSVSPLSYIQFQSQCLFTLSIPTSANGQFLTRLGLMTTTGDSSRTPYLFSATLNQTVSGPNLCPNFPNTRIHINSTTGLVTCLPTEISSSSSSSTGTNLLSSGTGSSPTSLSSSSSSAVGAVKGDPQFIGLLGQSFQVHGIDGQVYNLIFDQDFILNSRFRFLDYGKCPTIVKHTLCWTHPGSYLSELGLQTKSHRLQIVSGDYSTGFESVKLVTTDLLSISKGTNFTSDELKLWYHSSHQLKIVAGNFEIVVENSDRFVNLISVKVLNWNVITSEGLLGSTWKKDFKMKYVDDYAEENNDLFGDSFGFNISIVN